MDGEVSVMESINFVKVNENEIWAVIDDKYFGKYDRWHDLNKGFSLLKNQPKINTLNEYFQIYEAMAIYEDLAGEE